MFSTKFIILFLSKLILLSTCFNTKTKEITISGNIDYVGDANIAVSKKLLHYKYSPKKEYILSPDSEGNFNLDVLLENDSKLIFSIDDNSFLLLADEHDDLNLKINRSSFPLDIEVSSKNQSYYAAYQGYLINVAGLDTRIEKEMNNYKEGLENSAIALSKRKINLAQEHLSGTPYEELILKAKGELLVNQIKSIEYRFYTKNFDTSKERRSILEAAKKDGFFTLTSLKAQRAGIRDVTHYYSRTFGIYDSVNKAQGKELSEYNIKRLAYEELNEKRLQVIEYIEDRHARAYAELFLVAERIGEIELTKAEPSYEAYLNQYTDFPEYTEFLTYFHNEIKSVSPGEPAIPFSLVDAQGNTHTLQDYKGKYIMLDFWAGWCIPCLDEFPDMRKIYADFSREDFEIIAISTEIDKTVWETDINRFKNPWPQLYGGNGFDQETFRAYKGGGIPFYILIDPEGNIARYNDIRATFNLRDVLDELINE